MTRTIKWAVLVFVVFWFVCGLGQVRQKLAASRSEALARLVVVSR